VSEAPVWVSVSAHVQDATPVTVRLHPQDGRVVVLVGDSTGWPRLDLYLSRGRLAAFCDTLSAALVELDDAVQALTDTHKSDTDSATTDSTTGRAGSTDVVDGSAMVHDSAA
jgi:hypothetical protein